MVKRTKIGTLLFNFTNKVGIFIGNHKVLYYILNYTWGLLMTIIGWIVYLVIVITKKDSIFKTDHKLSKGIVLGKNWGGISLGTNVFVQNIYSKDVIYNINKTKELLNHEFGHTCQNALWGVLFLFVIAIPSLIRCIYYNTKRPDKDYDSIWFEGSATYIGENVK